MYAKIGHNYLPTKHRIKHIKIKHLQFNIRNIVDFFHIQQLSNEIYVIRLHIKILLLIFQEVNIKI